MGMISRLELSAFILLTAACPRANAGDAYRSLAKQFEQAGLRSNVKKVAVIAFVPQNGASASDGEYAAERLTTQLVRLGKIQVVERELLEKVMDEHRLMLTGVIEDGDMKAVGRVLAVDAVVSGFVFRSGDDIAVHARMIDRETGRVIYACDLKERRPAESEASYAEAPYALRDAVSSTEEPVDCGAGQAQLEVLERSVVGIKARYWAAKLREPGFSYASLTANPGSDIVTPEVRSRFYELLERWNRESGAPNPDSRELELLSNTERRIRRITDTCSG